MCINTKKIGTQFGDHYTQLSNHGYVVIAGRALAGARVREEKAGLSRRNPINHSVACGQGSGGCMLDAAREKGSFSLLK